MNSKDDKPATTTTPDYESFYGERRDETYGADFTARTAEEHTLFYPVLKRFIEQYDLAQGKQCLEIGSSGGCFQDMVDDYAGTDVSPELSKFYRKRFEVVNSDGTYPFSDGEFDAIWTHAVFEHIPNLQLAMEETVRMLKPGGLLLFHPAWQCRPWAADGYPVRPYSDFGLYGKLIKLSIPIRENIVYRSLQVFPKRILCHAAFLLGFNQTRFRYRKIEANYETYWMSDSDACNSMDPHDAILWFESHGLKCISHPMHLKAFSVRTGALIFQKSAEA